MVNQDPTAQAMRLATEHLHATERDLAEARERIVALIQENYALRIALRNANAGRQFSGRPLAPAATAGDCDAVWVSGLTGGRRVEDVDTGDSL